MPFKQHNPNPKGLCVGDCVVRAICTIMDDTWEHIYTELAIQGLMMLDMPSANAVWGSYLKNKGFKRSIIPNICPDCYTIREFVSEHPKGRYILATGTHCVAVIDGNYYDSWDSGDEMPIYYWVKEG